MTNKYMYFIANWKMFGVLKTLNSIKKVISFSKNYKKNKINIIYFAPTFFNMLAFTFPVKAPKFSF